MFTASIFLLSGLLAFPLFSSGVLVSHAATTSNKQVSLSISGEVVNAGSQQYNLQQSGQVATASIFGYDVNPLTSHFDYHYDAKVNGLAVSGNANFNLHGTVVGGAYNGWTLETFGKCADHGSGSSNLSTGI